MVLTERTERKQSGRRPVSAKWLIVVLVAVLAVAGGGAAVLLGKKADPRTAQARDAASAYLDAWSRADYEGMAQHADASPDVLRLVLEPIRTGLGVERQDYRPGELIRTDNSAEVPYAADLALTGLGPWNYDGSLRLNRGPDEVWRVNVVPAAIHPQLTLENSLTRTSIVGQRGRLLDRNGTALRGRDTDLDNNMLGSVGTFDEAQAKAAGSGFVAGDRGGQSGLERAYNAQLAGDPGGRIVLRPKNGGADQTLQEYPARDGADVRTTVDLRYQQAGRAALAGLGRSAALVAVDAKTGGVLSVVNNPAGGASTAIRGQYPPGSTYKIVTTVAALLAGRTENSPLNCPKTEFAGGRSWKNAEDEAFGPINLFQAFYHSCNTAYVNLRDELSSADMQRAADMFGFDGKKPLPIDSFGGTWPTGDRVDPYAAAFGQSLVEASPLQMASVAAAIAGGTWYRPHLVGKAPDSNAIPPNVVSQMQGMMRAVVTRGTAASVSFPGEVGGKTGTAEYGSGRNGEDPPTHAWFAGYRGDVGFAVLVPGGGFGAEVAAPVAARFLRQLDASATG